MENNETKNRKSGYNPNRKTYFTADGKYYCYLKWDDELKREVPMKYQVEKIPPEVTFILAEMDHKEDLNDRYENELKDPLFESKMNSFKDNPDDETLDPWNTIPDKGNSPEEIIFAEPEPVNHRVGEVHRVIEEECTENQQDLFYSHFGMDIDLVDLRNEEEAKTGKAVTKQAFTNRKNKIIDKVAKALGSERVKRCAVKEQG